MPLFTHLRSNRLLAVAALFIVPLLAAACGGSSDNKTTTTPGGSIQTSFDITAGDNYFEYGGQKKPTISVSAGQTITFNINNIGSAIHNMRFAGDDNKFDSSDDTVSNPALVPGGTKGKLTFTAPSKPGTYDFRCDYHPTDSVGKVTVG